MIEGLVKILHFDKMSVSQKSHCLWKYVHFNYYQLFFESIGTDYSEEFSSSTLKIVFRKNVKAIFGCLS